MKHYRLLGILLLLENNHVMTAKALATHFEVSIRTIYRDLDVLSEAGYGIITESGKGGGISLMYSKRLRLSAMDEHELIQLARQFAFRDSDDQLSENISLKIRSQLPPEAQNVFDHLTRSTLVDRVSWYGKVSCLEESLSTIQQGILHKKKLIIDYTSAGGFSTDRVIRPLGVVKKANLSYLVAYCERRGEHRVFNIDKISKLELSDEDFLEDDGFNLKSFWEMTTGNYRFQASKPAVRPISDAYAIADSSNESKGRYPVSIKCDEAYLIHLSGYKLLEMNSEGRYTFDMISETIAISQLFNHGDQVVVLEPKALVEAILDKARHIISHYEKH
jgi:predicted DNA-binding transcriptional regulator YafY